MATTMSSLFVALFALVASSFRTRAALQAEIFALRHQLAVFQKNASRNFGSVSSEGKPHIEFSLGTTPGEKKKLKIQFLTYRRSRI